jgi:hypothetical protein
LAEIRYFSIEFFFFCVTFCSSEYFGEKVAMYYAWFGYFTYFLLVPSILGVIIEIIYGYRGFEVTSDNLDVPTYVYAICVITWAAIYEHSWLRECKAIALKWGTHGCLRFF